MGWPMPVCFWMPKTWQVFNITEFAVRECSTYSKHGVRTESEALVRQTHRLKKGVCRCRSFCFPPWGQIWEKSAIFINSLTRNYKDRMRELYCVSLRVGQHVILVIARRTHGSIETPVAAQITHTLLFSPFSDWPRKLLISPHGWKKRNGGCYTWRDRGHFCPESPF